MSLFIEQIAPFAIKHGQASGILPSLIISQSCLESSFGKSENAVKANNLFGIKVGSGWTGEKYSKTTNENKPDGTQYQIVADFRKYASFENSIENLCHKYKTGTGWESHNRYQAIIGETDYKKVTEAIYKAGYATDPLYPQKLNKIIEQYDLTKYDKEMTSQMSYTIVNKYIPTSLYPLKAPYTMTPKYITIHNTANDATALNEIAYMTRNTAVTGYHVAIDDKQAVQAIPFNRNAYHAGDGQGQGNRASIGIEICYSKSGGSKYYEAEENTVEYTAHILKQYGWGIDRIKWHRDWSGKNCPHRMISEGRLDSFKKKVQIKLDELNGKKPPLIADATPTPSTNSPLKDAIANNKGGISVLITTSATLKKAYQAYLQKAINNGTIQKKWLDSYNKGELTISDAIHLDILISNK